MIAMGKATVETQTVYHMSHVDQIEGFEVVLLSYAVHKMDWKKKSKVVRPAVPTFPDTKR
jgi:hypothetical protein